MLCRDLPDWHRGRVCQQLYKLQRRHLQRFPGRVLFRYVSPLHCGILQFDFGEHQREHLSASEQRHVLLQRPVRGRSECVRGSAIQRRLDLSRDHLYQLPVGLQFAVLHADQYFHELHRLPVQLLVHCQSGESVPVEFRERGAVQRAESVYLQPGVLRERGQEPLCAVPCRLLVRRDERQRHFGVSCKFHESSWGVVRAAVPVPAGILRVQRNGVSALSPWIFL